ncbi:MAG: carotenoid oxygenase family protein [Acidimicrobiales bacterium]
MAMTAIATNMYLTANRAPVPDEVTALDLPVTGQIPVELEGRWLRNGPNPLPDSIDPATHHWFIGDGMVHGVRIRGGRAEWYRNRWLRSSHVAEALGESPVEGPRFGDRDLGPNTNVGGFAGRTWAMVEAGGTPMTMSYELDTIASDDFSGTLPGPFTAHPKYDPSTQELHAMVYSWPDLVDHIQYLVVGGDGLVKRCVDIPVDDMIMVHDMSLTERYAVVYDLPVTVDIDLAMAGRFPFRWKPGREARVGLLPRDGAASEIVWCPVQPCYVFHPLNAYDAPDGSVVLDVCRYEKMFDKDLLGPFGDSLATLDRWTVNPAIGSVTEERIFDVPQEFPRHAPSVGGRPYQFGYTAGVNPLTGPDTNVFGPTYKVHVQSGATERHDHGTGRGGAEPVFVARRDGSAEDDGWLMVLVHDATTDTSDLVILDAQDVAGPEVARIALPRRVPDGFHGNWVSDAAVGPDR